MKIAIVVPGGVDRSGEYRVIPALLALLQRLAARHEVHVFALRQELAPGRWQLRGAHIHNIGGSSGTPAQLRALAAIRREHRAAAFDLVQAIWSGGCGAVAVAAAKVLGVPSAVHFTGGELVALPAIAYGGRLRWTGRLREALVLRGATALSATSEPIIAQLAALGHASRRLPLGVDLQRWPPRDPVRRDLRLPSRLVHVASLNLVKDQTTLFHALAILSANGVYFQVDVVGEDTLGGRMQALVQRLGLAPRTRFHGFLTQTGLRPVMEQAHVNLMSSLHEAGPLVVLEAAALGIPSVGTAVGHLAEWAPQAALAVRVGDAAALAAAIGRLLDDEVLRLQLATEAHRRALLEDAEHTAALFEALYRELTAR